MTKTAKGAVRLTAKQEAFCLAYLETGNATEAYRRVYRCDSMKPETVNRNAKSLLDHNKIATRLQELNKDAVSSAVMSRREAMERLSSFARTDLADLIEFGSYELGADDNGAPVIQASWKVRDSVMQDPAKLAAITELSATKDGIKIKTHSPLQAIQQLAKMQGWESASKFEHSSPDGSMSPAPLDASKLSDAALKELMNARNSSGSQ